MRPILVHKHGCKYCKCHSEVTRAFASVLKVKRIDDDDGVERR